MSRINFGLICLVSILNQQKNQCLHKDEEEEDWKEMVEKVLVMRMVMELEMRVKRMMTAMRESQAEMKVKEMTRVAMKESQAEMKVKMMTVMKETKVEVRVRIVRNQEVRVVMKILTVMKVKMRQSLLKEDEEWASMLVEIRMMVQYPKMRILLPSHRLVETSCM